MTDYDFDGHGSNHDRDIHFVGHIHQSFGCYVSTLVSTKFDFGLRQQIVKLLLISVY
jgi:hypothetical protein